MRVNPFTGLLALAATPFAAAWLPTKDNGVIRGVNLGGLFVMEPWMQFSQWSGMGCGPYKSEFDCVMNLGQDKADAAFQSHWQSWITESDFQQMVAAGINTVRIPIGYWILEDLVYKDSEHFPRGGYPYLLKTCDLAKKYGLYVILDLHGAPGAQVSDNPFTGQYASQAGFYQDYQYTRALTFLGWLAKKIHTRPEFATVGTLQVLNEPLAYQPAVTASLLTSFYPAAYGKIRGVEAAKQIPKERQLHIMFMDREWGSGDPEANLPSTEGASYDYHKYVKWDTSVTANRNSYMQYSCTSTLKVKCRTPLVVGEWSLSVPDNLQESPEFSTGSADAVTWFQGWFLAQVQMYERSGMGWVFWNWKSTLGDWRWSYMDAVNAGVIPKDLGSAVGRNVCSGYMGKREVEAPLADVNGTSTAEVEEEVVVRRGKTPEPSAVRDVKRHVGGLRHRSLRHSHHHHGRFIAPSS
ncbi:glucan endo-1,6-beta-glucosidase [Drechslerella dactyloides]|uniref:glucan endo-1,6-beta-glucosidase n=1 Tax=Drechslerella dactyloides TaxID=74499 RepID=A0AAD6NLY5_DREDA|nr:glucan endo-1,6-beta-glucosidase [Drechslerella dactyloides]